ncbi:MAG: N-acetylglucosamine kinase [Aequorivita sp.]|nr:N-acetylglucosamine kinase [Aequorivita sp.]MAO49013.1 N-acetylglucosamine kinase [Aequorivita sp.]MBF30734.1 N-acetylglucosamine kinase [Aequorivita sp.]|tara:strand:- start:101618 stop:102520 length:903 start_codon:yes stop_codon:yes gene_type:complete
MTLITDGGSTKCDWVLLDNSGNIVFKTATLGLNPAIVPKEELIARIVENQTLNDVFKSVEMLDFYGAGCGTATPRSILKEVLQGLFVKANVNVYEDMAAAVFATTTAPGIVCILGTGSNSCYFDGTEIHSPIPSLGFILMDEASGNYFGKKLLLNYFYQRMPSEIAEEFEREFNLGADYIKINLYKKPNPNAYLASFAQFIFRQPGRQPNFEKFESGGKEINPYFYALIKEGILNFIEYRILCYEKAHEVPVHFIGSIAHFSEKIIKECFNEHNLELGNIVQRPIDGLIDYYNAKISNRK